jgi:putative acetyltransferase
MIEIVPYAPEDAAAVDGLVRAAFPGPEEAGIIERLRAGGDMLLELVARDGAAIVGHVGFSRLRSEPPRLRAVCLAPLAVAEPYRRQGVGHQLVEAGIARIRDAGEDVILVLGEPAYYGRFGFSAEAAVAYRTPYDGPYQQALWLGSARPPDETVLHYSPAFG